MSLQFTRHEVESDLRDCYKNGSIRRVSIISGIGYSYVDRGVNPNDEHKGFPFSFLEIQCALDEYDAEAGEKHWQAVQRFRELSKTHRAAGRVDDELSLSIKEDADVCIAHVEGKPLFDQLKEVDESLEQKKKLRAAIIAAINSTRRDRASAVTRGKFA